MAAPNGVMVTGPSFTRMVEIENGTLYGFGVDASNDNYFRKSTDGGITWGSATVLRTGTVINQDVWYDGWSGITATHYIHVAYIDSGSDDAYYRYIDTANSDTLGTERTVFAGSSTATSKISITRARGGNLICAVDIDDGTEYDTVKSTDLFATKSSISEVWEGATSDTVTLLPGWAVDTQDVMATFYDSSATELSIKFYDDSGDSWSESALSSVSIAVSSKTEAVDIVNSCNVVTTWTAHDTLNADLLCWSVTTSASAVTNVITDSVDDQIYSRIIVDQITGYWYCFYNGKSDGSESVSGYIQVYYKISTDQGTSWGSETLASGFGYELSFPFSSMPFGHKYKRIILKRNTVSTQSNYVIMPDPNRARATYVLGM